MDRDTAIRLDGMLVGAMVHLDAVVSHMHGTERLSQNARGVDPDHPLAA